MEELWECGRVWWSVDCPVDGGGESCKLECGGFCGEGSFLRSGRFIWKSKVGCERDLAGDGLGGCGWLLCGV